MKSHYLTVFLLPFLLAGSWLQAQEESAPTATGTGSVSGVVYEEEDATAGFSAGDIPVPGAKVTLVSLPDREEVQVLLTGEDGQFNFENVPFGEYEVRIEYISGLMVATQPFAVASASQELDLQIPVITEASAPFFSNLRVVNPANVRGPEVSTFRP